MLAKCGLQNDIKDDKGVVHRFMSSYEALEANSNSVLSLSNGLCAKVDKEKDLGIYLHKTLMVYSTCAKCSLIPWL